MSSACNDDLLDDLFMCARFNDVDGLQRLLSATGTQLHTVYDEHGNNLVHFASGNNSVDVLVYILSRCSIDYANSRNESGNTPLHWATLNGHVQSIAALLKFGCDPWTKNDFGKTPFDEAEQQQQSLAIEEIVQLYSPYLSTTIPEE